VEVRLVNHTPEPERTMASAARLCYADVSAAQLVDQLQPRQIEDLLQRVISSGHHSVLEHASFSLAIDGISRAASHQLVRHRLASFSQQSQRYVQFDKPSYVVPPRVQADPALCQRFEAAVAVTVEAYRDLLLAGMPAEDARYVLPNAWTTRLVMTMNARELLHVCGVRLCSKAQWEIRHLFAQVKNEVTSVAPLFGRHLAPKCVAVGYCDERDGCGLRPRRPTS
jgi:thymidylate synthase (FAD)